MAKHEILVVEDDPVCAQLCRGLLLRAGYTVGIAGDAAALAVALSRSLPQLILLDLALPFMDGARVARALKADRRFARIPVVALSGAGTTAADEALVSGCAGFIAKPLDARTFEASVTWFLDPPRFPYRPVQGASGLRFPASAAAH